MAEWYGLNELGKEIGKNFDITALNYRADNWLVPPKKSEMNDLTTIISLNLYSRNGEKIILLLEVTKDHPGPHYYILT